MNEQDSKKLESATIRVMRLLQEVDYKTELLSFCLLAARQLVYRFILIILPGMDFKETKERMNKLEQWPSPGVDPWCYGTKEIWIPKDNKKEFDIFEYCEMSKRQESFHYEPKIQPKMRWLNKDNRTTCFDIDKMHDFFSHKTKAQPKMSRGRIDRKGGCVYFLYAPNNKAVKIGKTTNLKRRLKSFKTALPNAKLLGFMESQAPYELESDLHRKFAEYHVRGEWFFYQGKLKEYIKKRVNNG